MRAKPAGSGVDPRAAADRSGEGERDVLWSATTQFWQSGPRDRLGVCPEEVGMLVEDQDTQDAHDVEDVSAEDIDELLVEEVSIDGMCGVY
jgi:mycofactocin precursor